MMAYIDTLTRKMKAQGLCDCPPKVAARYNKLFEVIEYHYKVHGAGKIDTPFLLHPSIVPLYGNQVQLLCVKLDNGSIARADLTVSLVQYSVRNGVTHGKLIQLPMGYSCRIKNGKISILRQFPLPFLDNHVEDLECYVRDQHPQLEPYSEINTQGSQQIVVPQYRPLPPDLLKEVVVIR